MAFFVRDWMGLGPLRTGNAKLITSRVLQVRSTPLATPHWTSYSGYLKSGGGLGAENLAYLECIGAHIQQQEGEWPLAGDFNVPPEMLANSDFVSRVEGTILRPTLGRSTYWYTPSGSETRKGRVLDY